MSGITTKTLRRHSQQSRNRRASSRRDGHQGPLRQDGRNLSVGGPSVTWTPPRGQHSDRSYRRLTRTDTKGLMRCCNSILNEKHYEGRPTQRATAVARHDREDNSPFVVIEQSCKIGSSSDPAIHLRFANYETLNGSEAFGAPPFVS